MVSFPLVTFRLRRRESRRRPGRRWPSGYGSREPVIRILDSVSNTEWQRNNNY